METTTTNDGDRRDLCPQCENEWRGCTCVDQCPVAWADDAVLDREAAQ